MPENGLPFNIVGMAPENLQSFNTAANGSILDGGRRMAGVTAGCFPAPQQAKERRFTAAVQLRLYVVAPYVCALSTVALVAVGFGWASALKLWWSWRL
ncbi:hypothetical protein MTO96_036655 [Rhipicephalus appendiculatus]